MNSKNHTLVGIVFFVTVFSCATLMGFQDAVDKNRVPGDALEKPTTQQRLAERSFRESEPTFTPVELKPVAAPITLNLEADSRAIYDNIGKLTGLTVVFDEDYVLRPIRVDLHGVPLREALNVVAFESKTFWRPVTPNSIYVAADTQIKRRELNQSVIKVFQLAGISSAQNTPDKIASPSFSTVRDNMTHYYKEILDCLAATPRNCTALPSIDSKCSSTSCNELCRSLFAPRPVARRLGTR